MDFAPRTTEMVDEDEPSGSSPGHDPEDRAREETPADEGSEEAADEAPEEPRAAAGDEPAEPKGPGPGDALDDEALCRAALALLFASPEPLSQARLTDLLERPRAERVRAALEAAGQALDASGLPVVLRQIAGGWRLLTDPAMGEVIGRLRKAPKAERISSAALETLAIVAYRQPVTKAEVEAIRGVQSGPLLRTLVDRGLVRVTGRADQPGSPLQYGTTRDFLDRFGLASLDDLPRDGELASG